MIRNFYETEEQAHPAPEHEYLSLLLAIVERAVKDVAGFDMASVTPSQRREYAKGAERWLRDLSSDAPDDAHCIKYRWICDSLGLDPSVFRAQVASRIIVPTQRGRVRNERH